MATVGIAGGTKQPSLKNRNKPQNTPNQRPQPPSEIKHSPRPQQPIQLLDTPIITTTTLIFDTLPGSVRRRTTLPRKPHNSPINPHHTKERKRHNRQRRPRRTEIIPESSITTASGASGASAIAIAIGDGTGSGQVAKCDTSDGRDWWEGLLAAVVEGGELGGCGMWVWSGGGVGVGFGVGEEGWDGYC